MFSISKHFARPKNLKIGQQWFIYYSTEINKISSVKKQCPISMQGLYGQPTPTTHPHLLEPKELTPGIQMIEYKKRRNTLIERVTKNKPHSENLVIITSACKKYMSGEIPYIFRQNTEFFYFTGCMEPDSAIILHGQKNGNCRSIMFVRPKDQYAEMWDGHRTGTEAAKELFGVDDSLPLSEFDKYCADHMRNNREVQVWYDANSSNHPLFSSKLGNLIGSQQCISPLSIMHEMRSIKSATEIKLLQKSCDVTSEAMKETIRATKPGISEHQLFATIDYQCRMNGANMLAYPPVVAAGNNATTIHYINNNQIIKDGDLVLVDAGSDYHGYASDITRTWPANGRFSSLQRVLYEILLDVQETLIKLLADMPPLDDVFKQMCWLLGHRLCCDGIVEKVVNAQQKFNIGYSFCPHHVSHYLGMDVHDTPCITRNHPVRPGMVVTIEPGIYVTAKNEFARREFHGIGVRMEDDVLITESGPVILSKNCPKSLDEVEALARLNSV